MNVVDSAKVTLVEPPSLPQQEARRLTDQIRLGLDGVWELAARAWQGRAWQSLGYGSWDEYCTRELGTCRMRPPDGDALRAALWAPLSEAGMSHRAIASVAGVSRQRVHQALRLAQEPPARVLGMDGKMRPSLKPTKAEVLIRQANAARLRNQGLKQTQIAAELGVTQATVSTDLAQIDQIRAALTSDVDVEQLLEEARDGLGRTDATAVAAGLGLQTVSSKNLSRLVRQPTRDLEATLRVVVNDVVLADEWLDPAERSAALAVLLPATARILGQLRQIVDATPDSDRCGEQWQALAEAIADLERAGGAR